jgi:hypothetical protein
MNVYFCSHARIGYDVVFLANENRHVTGMDLSPTCVDLLHKVKQKLNRNLADEFNFKKK